MEVYAGMCRYVGVYGSIWGCMEVYSGICVYMMVYEDKEEVAGNGRRRYIRMYDIYIYIYIFRDSPR